MVDMEQYEIRFDNAVWQPVPSEFPAEDDTSPDSWVLRQRAEIAAATPDASPDDLDVAESIARGMLDSVDGRASWLWFRPGDLASDVLISISINELGDGPAPSLAEILEGSGTTLAPTMELVETDTIGTGTVIRRAIAPDTDDTRAQVAVQTTGIFMPPGWLIIVDAIGSNPAALAVLDLHMGNLLAGISLPRSATSE